MFWIPIAAVVSFIYFITHLVGVAISSKAEARLNGFLNAKETLASIAVDEEFEDEVARFLGTDLKNWKQIVCDFMGGDSEWMDYTTYSSGKLKAKLVLMALHGKIPKSMIDYGERLSLTPDRDGKHISSKRGREMNELFMLKLEDYLVNEQGVDAMAYVQSTEYQNGKLKMLSMPLKNFINEYGAGATNYFTVFRLISHYRG